VAKVAVACLVLIARGMHAEIETVVKAGVAYLVSRFGFGS